MPQTDIFCRCYLLVGLTAGLQIEFYAQKFPLDCRENGRLGYLFVLCNSITRRRCLCPRLIHFSGCNLPVGLMAGLQLESKAHNCPLNCLENGQIGTLLFRALAE
jgi:hypothetical protein